MATNKETDKSQFYLNVIEVIKDIPKSKLSTYGAIAEKAGKKGAARTVAWFLHSSSKKHNLPWHRVVNAKGKISFPQDSVLFAKQIRKLESEGVEVSEKGQINLDEFRHVNKKSYTD